MLPQIDGSAPLLFYRSTPERPRARARPEPEPVLLPGGRRPKKHFTRRYGDSSQRIRTAMQLAFMGVTVLSGVQFYFWVRFYETGGQTWKVSRPAGVEACRSRR